MVLLDQVPEPAAQRDAGAVKAERQATATNESDADQDSWVKENCDVLFSYTDVDLLFLLETVLAERASVLQDLVDWAVPERAYVSSRLLAECRGTGTIKCFNEAKGYGFIECPDVAEAFECDVFLHHGQVGPFQVGDQVSFALLLNKDRKPQAFDLAACTKDGVDLRGQPWHGRQNGEEEQRAGPQNWSSPNSTARSSSAAGPASAKGSKRAEKGSDDGGTKAAKGMEASSSTKGKAGSKGTKEGKATFIIAKTEVQTDTLAISTPRRRGAAMAAYGAQLRRQVKGEKGKAKGSETTQEKGRGQSLAIMDKGMSKGKGSPHSSAGTGKNAGPSNDASDYAAQEIPGLTDRPFEGYIKSFNTVAGWGFIANEEIARMRGGDIFLHSNALGSFDVGDYVSFWVQMNKQGKPQACDLKAAEPGGKSGKKRPAGGSEKGGKGGGSEWESGGSWKKGRGAS